MNKSTVWLLGGTAVVLVYSAYKNESPTGIVRKALTGGGLTPLVTDAAVTSTAAGTPSSLPASRTNYIPGLNAPPGTTGVALQPHDLTPIGQGFQLASRAASAFKVAESIFGGTIPLVGAFRTYQQELDLKASGGHGVQPDYNHAFHVQGLAVDVSAGSVNDPKVIAALQAAGFHQFDPTNAQGEAHHWSYGVTG